MIRVVAQRGEPLDATAIAGALSQGLEPMVRNERVLVLIPDHTRTIPLTALFPILVESLRTARSIDFMVALGTHPPLDEDALYRLVGMTLVERNGVYRNLILRNHAWQDASALTSLGTISQDRVKDIAGDAWHPTLGGDVDVRINKAAVDVDRILIVGPTFPHEVAGFSGGAKYLFPGISGPEMINVTHWLGALKGIIDTIGIKDTPVRTLIDEAAALLSTAVTLLALVVDNAALRGLFLGGLEEAWQAAAGLSAETHIEWLDTPQERVISWAPPMYDELWTAGKAMYKLEPALAEGAEIVIYAPHLDTVSAVHGRHICNIGYHVLPYFLDQWERFREVPLGVLAHSTHVKGAGTYASGVERPRVDVKLASLISPGDCRQLNLGYVDPSTIDPERPEDGVFLVRKAGEMLYRVRPTGLDHESMQHNGLAQ